jgi:Fic family protein
MALAQDEKLGTRFYSMPSQAMEMRDEYYEMLENVQTRRADVTEWFLWFIKYLGLSISSSQVILSNVFARVDFWKRHGQTDFSERQKKVLNRVLEAGPGNLPGGLTTRKYVSFAKVSRATAFREIADMLDKKALRQLPGKGRNVHYDLIRPKASLIS